MKKRKGWQGKLTKKELRHIKETTDTGTLAQFKRNREAQRNQKEIGGKEECWDCRFIAKKLGLEA